MLKWADCILAFESEGVIYFNGNYEQYCGYKESQQQEEKTEEVVTKVKNNSNKEQKEQVIEEKMTEWEELSTLLEEYI